MNKQPPNSALGRHKILQGRRERAERHDLRIALEIARAASLGANSLQKLCDILNNWSDGSPPVPTRTGVAWTRPLASVEMVKMGISIKALHKYVHRPANEQSDDIAIHLVARPNIMTGELELSERSKETIEKLDVSIARKKRRRDRAIVIDIQPNNLKIGSMTQLSEEAFWKIVAEQNLVAEKYGVWVPIMKHRPKSGDIIRHRDKGIGVFVDDDAGLLCRFWQGDQNTLIKVEPIKTDVFTWGDSIRKAQREFSRIQREHATNSAFVDVGTITREQKLARYRVIRWRI